MASTSLAPKANVPALTCVLPVYVLVPLSVTVPAVVLFKPTLPPNTALTVPACISNVLFDVNVPVPVIEPDSNCTPATASLWLPRSKLPPLTIRLEVLASTSPAPKANVPALTCVLPVYVLVPLSVTVPAVVLFNPTLPPNTALTVPACISNVLFEVNVPVPVIEPDSNCTPATASLWLPKWKLPPLTIRLEVLASTSLLPKANVPALTCVLPVYVLVPLSVTVPAVVLFNPTLPPNTALTVPACISKSLVEVNVPAPLKVAPACAKLKFATLGEISRATFWLTLITASSAAPGLAAHDQLAGVDQMSSPPCQLQTAASAVEKNPISSAEKGQEAYAPTRRERRPAIGGLFADSASD